MVPTAFHPVIDVCEWHDRYGWRNFVHFNYTGSVVLPFLSRLRVFEIYIDAFTLLDLNILTFLIGSLSISLTSPATLQHLKSKIRIQDSNYHFFCRTLRDTGVWSYLNSITSHSTGSRLQRVEINIEYSLLFNDCIVNNPDKDEIEKSVVDGLPLLHTEGILFVQVVLVEGN